MLDIWPALPLIVQGSDGSSMKSGDNIVAALERSDRVCQIDLKEISTLNLEKFSAAMQQPFPELIHIQLWLDDKIIEAAPVLPDSFLGNSSPCLRELNFCGIPFPGLPMLLLSTIHLVHLALYDIPHSGYFPPDGIVTALPSLTSLETLRLQFQSPLSYPNRASRRPPPPTRFILPVLTHFWFKGVGEFLEDLVARIDAPRLGNLEITFFNQIIFDTPQFIQFLSRLPTLSALEKASMSFEDGAASIELSSRTSYRGLNVRIPCKELDWQVSSLEQVCTSCLPPLSMLEDLYISEQRRWQRHWKDNIENTLWLELLRPFTAVKNLYLSDDFSRRIVPAMQELVGGGTTEVLPTLQNTFLEGLRSSVTVQQGIGQFVATRQAMNRPIAVVQWNRRSH